MILFIDDEPTMAKLFTVEFDEAGLDYALKTDVDSAWNFFQDEGNGIKLIILDIMMASGRLFENEDTDAGFTTGIHFYSMIRRIRPELPIIILTNVNDDYAFNSFRNDTNCQLFQKIDIPPHMLVEEIATIVSGLRKPKETRDEYDDAGDSVTEGHS